MTYQPQQPTATQPPAPAQAKSRVVPILIGAVAVLLLAVAGLAFALLSGDDEKPVAVTASPASAVATTAASTAPAVPATFAKVADLRAALIDHGIACNKSELIKHDGQGPVGLIDDSLSCDRAGAELVLDVYDTSDNASGRIAYQAALLEGFGLDPSWFVVGENWTVHCDTQADCVDVAAAIGGRVESTA